MSEERLAALICAANDMEKRAEALRKEVNSFLKGRRIRVTHKYWNGQMCGVSWPKLCGKEFVIDHAIVDRGAISVWYNGTRHYCYMPLSYGELLP